MMKDDGFLFPANVKTVPPGSDMKVLNVTPPDLSFLYEVETPGRAFVPAPQQPQIKAEVKPEPMAPMPALEPISYEQKMTMQGLTHLIPGTVVKNESEIKLEIQHPQNPVLALQNMVAPPQQAPVKQEPTCVTENPVSVPQNSVLAFQNPASALQFPQNPVLPQLPQASVPVTPTQQIKNEPEQQHPVSLPQNPVSKLQKPSQAPVKNVTENRVSVPQNPVLAFQSPASALQFPQKPVLPQLPQASVPVTPTQQIKNEPEKQHPVSLPQNPVSKLQKPSQAPVKNEQCEPAVPLVQNDPYSPPQVAILPPHLKKLGFIRQ